MNALQIFRPMFLVPLLIVGALYAVQWERSSSSNEYVEKLTQLLDDRVNPGANDFSGRRARLCQMLVTLQDASKAGLDQRELVSKAALRMKMGEMEAKILVDSMSLNSRMAATMGLLEVANRADMERGILPEIADGPYAGSEVDFEYIVPLGHAPELETKFANLALRPEVLTERFGEQVDMRSYEKAAHFYQAAVISHSSLQRVGAEFESH